MLLDNIANRNSFLIIIVDGFNATSKKWCSGDKTTYEPEKFKTLTSEFKYKQVISNLNHILEAALHV